MTKGGPGPVARELATAIGERYATAPAGSPVPSTAELKRQFGRNENTIRHALDILFQQGFIWGAPGKPRCFTGIGTQTQWNAMFAGRPILEVLGFRLMLEPAAAMDVAQLCKGKAPGFWEDLARAYAKFEAASESKRVDVWLKADQEFHAAIHALVANPLVRWALQRTSYFVFENVGHVVRHLYELEAYRRDVLDEHGEMFHAITDNHDRDDNGRTAWEATYRHLNSAHTRIRDHLGLR